MITIGLLDRVKIDETRRISDGVGLFVVKEERGNDDQVFAGVVVLGVVVTLYCAPAGDGNRGNGDAG